MMPLPICMMQNQSSDKIYNQIDLSGYFNAIGIIDDNFAFSQGLDGTYAFSSGAIGLSQNIQGLEYIFGASGSNNAIVLQNITVTPIINQCDYIYIIATSVGGVQEFSLFVVYSDSSSVTFDMHGSDWATPISIQGESIALEAPYRNKIDGTTDATPVYMYLYKFKVDKTKQISSMTFNGIYTRIFAINQVNDVYDLAALFDPQTIHAENGALITNWTDTKDKYAFNGSNVTYITGEINGRPIVRFVSSELSSNIASPRNSYSVFSVFKESTPGTYMIATSWGDGSPGTMWQGYSQGGDHSGDLVVASNSQQDIFSPSSNSDTNWHIAECIFDNGIMSGYDKGVLIETIGSSLVHRPTDTFKIGNYSYGSFYWVGDIAEIIIFNKALSSTERITIEKYLIAKYNL